MISWAQQSKCTWAWISLNLRMRWDWELKSMHIRLHISSSLLFSVCPHHEYTFASCSWEWSKLLKRVIFCISQNNTALQKRVPIKGCDKCVWIELRPWLGTSTSASIVITLNRLPAGVWDKGSVQKRVQEEELHSQITHQVKLESGYRLDDTPWALLRACILCWHHKVQKGETNESKSMLERL